MSKWIENDDIGPGEFRRLAELCFDSLIMLWKRRAEMKPPRRQTMMLQTEEGLIVYAPGEHQQAIIDFVESLDGSN